jgi:hypothetical protein
VRRKKKRIRYVADWRIRETTGHGRQYFDGYVLLAGAQRDSDLKKQYLDRFLAELREDIAMPNEPERVGAIEMLERAVTDCEAAVTSGADAELVRIGYRIGRALAFYDRYGHFLAVLRANRTSGKQTRLSKLEKRNEQMVADYLKLQPSVGDLEARRRIRTKYPHSRNGPLTLQQVNNVLDRYGVRESQ